MNQDETNPTPPPEDSAGADVSHNAASASTRPKPLPPTTKPLPRWRVLLHNDDVNEMQYIVNTIISLTRLEASSAVEKTNEAHKSGLSLLLTTHQERAELFQQQFQSANVTVTIEPEEA
jgi:ATP-dependent Clp protease adaptor protein ClpS